MTTTSENGGMDNQDLGPPTDPESAAARIAEIRELLQAFDDTPHTDMTQLYYLHGFNELDLAVRDLLHIIDAGLGTPNR